MTLHNSKLRRGRKPKKADICHLIYQNYRTAVPGQPLPCLGRLNQLTFCSSLRIQNSLDTAKIDLQNRIITNLLERKLLHEDKRRQGIMASNNNIEVPIPAATVTEARPLVSDDKPLNLCIRDLKIQMQRKFGDNYLSMPKFNNEIVLDTEIVGTKNEKFDSLSVKQKNSNVLVSFTTPRNLPELPQASRCSNAGSPSSNPAASTYSLADDKKFSTRVFWPSAGLYIHPLGLSSRLLYYQQLAAASQMLVSPQQQKNIFSTWNSTNGSNSTVSNYPLNDDVKNLVINHISELIDPKVTKRVKDSEPSLDQMKNRRSSRNSTVGSVKKKRSAIFIPPKHLNSNSTTPVTEVNICKFKFTGGSKPSLQEKKRLSVDSGGNFRYYSGTGNKGIVYETGQNESNPSRSSEVAPEPSMSMTSKSKDQSTIVPKDKLGNKNKSRKSLQREKLEQKFKERGFLIQTQQLQSAEGATYCKFRQLRKFSRYLFRSWKDYLPGELEEQNMSREPPAEGVTMAEGQPPIDIDPLGVELQ